MSDYLIEQADPDLAQIWSERNQLRTDVKIWIAVMNIQHLLEPGLIGDNVVRDTSRYWNKLCLDGVRLDQLLDYAKTREAVTRHDVKARLEVMCREFGHQKLHLGMTSADIVENRYTLLMAESLRRLSNLWSQLDLESVIATLPWRGIKGAVGTMADQIQLLGSAEKAHALDAAVARHFVFRNQLVDAVGQVNHRSADFQMAQGLLSKVMFAAPPTPGRNPWRSLMGGYVNMLADISHQTWNEGDVWQSVVRRVAIPNLFLAADVTMRYWYD